MKSKVSVQLMNHSYDIVIQNNIMKELPKYLKETYPGKKLALCCESNVSRIIGNEFLKELLREGCDAFLVVFPEGEIYKTLATLTGIYETLAQHQFSRSDILIALGGGVTGDMAGFAAATYLRGTKFIQIPTSLLAMVDSSIGGKLAVDLPQGKNLVGAFYQPHAVFTDPVLLETLDNRQFFNGMAELIKHGFIFDSGLVQQILACYSDDKVIAQDKPILSNPESILKASLKDINDVRNSLNPFMVDFITRSCDLKRKVVEIDEKDEGPRQLLNFGHTLGHAIEKVTGFGAIAHGEAISIGMSLFTQMSEDKGWTEPGTAIQVKTVLQSLFLPTELPKLDETLLFQAISSDKKVRSGEITIVTLDRIGAARLRTIPLTSLKELLHRFLSI